MSPVMTPSDIQKITDLKGVATPFNSLPQVKRARDDFQYLCSKLHVFAMNNIQYMSLSRNGIKVGDAFPIPFDVNSKKTTVPKDMINLNDPKLYVAVVCYQNGDPIDVLMLNTSLFQKRCKFIKLNKGTNEYLIKIKDISHDSIRKYAFGLVVGQIQ